MTTVNINQLTVPRAEFVEELRRMLKVLGRGYAGEALLLHDAGRLVIRIGGAEFSVQAEGCWNGEARISASLLRALAKVPPAKDPVSITVKAGRLRIGSSSTPCRWQVPGAATIEIPLGLDLRGRLRLAYGHTQDELEKSGVAPVIATAHQEMERCIELAARRLAPLGVSPADVRLMVISRLENND